MSLYWFCLVQTSRGETASSFDISKANDAARTERVLHLQNGVGEAGIQARTPRVCSEHHRCCGGGKESEVCRPVCRDSPCWSAPSRCLSSSIPAPEIFGNALPTPVLRGSPFCVSLCSTRLLRLALPCYLGGNVLLAHFYSLTNSFSCLGFDIPHFSLNDVVLLLSATNHFLH